MTGDGEQDWSGGYAPQPGVPDELMTADGSIRPAWSEFHAHLSRLDRDELSRRFALGDQYLRDAGVFFRQYGDPDATERAWPLSHIPMILGRQDHGAIEEGLVQRAELLERVMADLYGAGSLVRNGQLPARLVAQNPEWLRPLVGLTPRGGHFLHFLAFELGRSPDGTWFVLGDRTQAPSGAGFAVENRLATSRVFPDFYARGDIHRLAGFFRRFRDGLNDLKGAEAERIGILSPGPLNDTYFEHAYIARYLGFMLLEGEDLIVRDGRVMVRTVAGPQPVDVLWRRLDSRFADPLELDQASAIGTPGMVGAIRSGNLTMVNALGSGVLETRAFLAFLPRICRALLGEPLKMPNIATWWCGQTAERDYTKANAHRVMIGPAMSQRLPFEDEETTALGAWARDSARQAVDDWLDREGAHVVGQEAVTLSTTPAFVDGRLRPRPMTLRVFLARGAEGWRMMPGGYARIGLGDDPTAIGMQAGGSVADVWVRADESVSPESMIAGPATFTRARRGVLPSRAADNLYWLGRYVDRAESAIRMLRCYHLRLAESGERPAPILDRIAGYLAQYGLDPRTEPIPAGVCATLDAAQASAGKVRDRFSVDGWTALTGLARAARDSTDRLAPGDETARTLGELLRQIAGFTGLVQDNMFRFTGWRFLTIGRALERADRMAAVLADFADPGAPAGSLDVAVEAADSVMSHRRRYAVETNRATVVDLLALDTLNPRAILHQLGRIREQVGCLPGAEVEGQMSDLSRAVLRAHTGLAVRMPADIDTPVLTDLRREIAGLSELLGRDYLR